MSDYFMRDAAPFCADTWAKIDDMVVTVARRTSAAAARGLVGPLGWGVELAPKFGFTQEDGADVVAGEAQYLAWRGERRVHHHGQAVADGRADALWPRSGCGGHGGVAARPPRGRCYRRPLEEAGNHAALGDWETLGGPFKAIADAIAALQNKGVDGPFALVLSPAMFARLASLMSHGRRELRWCPSWSRTPLPVA